MLTLAGSTHRALIRLPMLVFKGASRLISIHPSQWRLERLRNQTFAPHLLNALGQRGITPVPFNTQPHECLLIIEVEMRCSTGCVHSVYLVCMSCPCWSPHNCELSFQSTPMDTNGRRICMWADLALHLRRCLSLHCDLCVTESYPAPQRNRTVKTQSWCSLCHVNQRRQYAQ